MYTRIFKPLETDKYSDKLHVADNTARYMGNKKSR